MFLYTSLVLLRFSLVLARTLFCVLFFLSFLCFYTQPLHFFGLQYLEYAMDPLKEYTTVMVEVSTFEQRRVFPGADSEFSPASDLTRCSVSWSMLGSA